MFPTSDTQAYKKARRQHLKTTRKRGKDVGLDWTAFRAAEKHYKARFPPPDLSNVLDLGTLAGVGTDKCCQRLGGPIECKELSPKVHGEFDDQKVYIVPSIPGLVLLPSFISSEGQRDLVRWSLHDQARHPNETNLDIHYVLPQNGLWNAYLNSRTTADQDVVIQPRVSPEYSPSKSMSPQEASGPRTLINNTPATIENFALLSKSPKPSALPSPTLLPASPIALLPKLRWANIGWSYHWGSKQYDFSKGRGSVHANVKDVCKRAVAVVDWEQVFGSGNDADWGDSGPDWRTWGETYEPDAGIVNFYQSKDTLMAHVDRSEFCATSPLVSISLGNAAIFLIGGLTRDVEPVAILLRSGDVIIMSGPTCRRAYHGVPRILENTLPAHLKCNDGDVDWAVYREYLQSARINVNVRQVFPKGFNPALGLEHESPPPNTELPSM